MKEKEPVEIIHDKERKIIDIEFRDGDFADESEQINLMGGIDIFIDRDKKGNVIGMEIMYIRQKKEKVRT